MPLPATPATRGIHHITAIAPSASENLRFYTEVLGLRLVKRTVNFDDPHTYHLYYGDGIGTPGSLLTFFPWERAPAGRPGRGGITALAFAVPSAALGFWTARLRSAGIDASALTRFDEELIAFRDPHGLPLELVAVENPAVGATWDGSPVPDECRIAGIHSAAATVPSRRSSEPWLTEVLGFRPLATEGRRTRFRAAGPGPGPFYDLIDAGDTPAGVSGGGTVHHIAFRAADAAEQSRWRDRLTAQGVPVTPVIDRTYFRSIYFRETGGVLMEIATDAPGFAVDEPVPELGQRLMLPSRYEAMRVELERTLPPLRDAAAPSTSAGDGEPGGDG